MRVSIDDFGTGYVSVSDLWRFPVHVLKVGRSLISQLERCCQHDAPVRISVKLDRALEIDTIAEETEDEAQPGRGAAIRGVASACGTRVPAPPALDRAEV